MAATQTLKVFKTASVKDVQNAMRKDLRETVKTAGTKELPFVAAASVPFKDAKASLFVVLKQPKELEMWKTALKAKGYTMLASGTCSFAPNKVTKTTQVTLKKVVGNRAATLKAVSHALVSDKAFYARDPQADEENEGAESDQEQSESAHGAKPATKPDAQPKIDITAVLEGIQKDPALAEAIAKQSPQELAKVMKAQKVPGKYSYIQQNLKDLFRRPWSLIADVDMAWVEHASRSLYDTAVVTYETSQKRKEREAIAKVARERADKDFAERVKSNRLPTYGTVREHLDKSGAGEFRLESQACRLLGEYVADFMKLDMIAKTQTGMSAYNQAAGLLKQMGDAATDAYNEYEQILKRLDGHDDDEVVVKEDFVEATAWLGKYRGRGAEVAGQIAKIGQVCAEAIEFETVKAYVVAVMEAQKTEKATDDVTNTLIKSAQKLATSTSDAFSSVADSLPGQTGTIAGAVSAFVSSGTTTVDKIVTSARRSRQVKRIRNDPAQMQKMITAMRAKPEMMAEYLSAKYMANLKRNLVMADPLVYFTGVGLDAASQGVPVGRIMTTLWDTVKTAVIEVADSIQKERIKRATAALKDVRSVQEPSSQAAKAWNTAQELLKKPLEDKLDSVFNTSVMLAETVQDAAAIIDLRPLRKRLVKDVTAILMERVLAKVDVPPAQLFTADEFIGHLTHFATVGRDAQRMGVGASDRPDMA